jgi:DNA-binding transcriptional regulator YdaS (Cro superfamily)
MFDAQRLREHMASRKITQEEVAAVCGVSTSLVGHWLAGRRELDPDRAPSIELATGLRCEQFMPHLHWNRDCKGRVTGYTKPLPEAADRAA